MNILDPVRMHKVRSEGRFFETRGALRHDVRGARRMGGENMSGLPSLAQATLALKSQMLP